jgi:hypothetical protein
MITAFLDLCAKLFGLTDFILRRRAAKADDPRSQIQKQKNENREAIAGGTAGELLNKRLDRLPPPGESP